MTKCKLCGYTKRADIEKAVATHKLSLAAAGELVGCSNMSIQRHMTNHVSEKAIKAAEALDLAEGLNVVTALTESRARILSIYEKAMDSDDLRAAVSALQTEVSQLSLMGKVTGQFSDQSQVNVLVTGQDDPVMAVILSVLEPYPEIRQTLADALDELTDDT
jgi:hypothetical protein